MTAQSTETVATEATAPQHGAELIVPLNRLKASPKNARKTPHAPATIEALAASIKAKGVLQPPVIEIERTEEGEPTGNYLVTIGEGRRQGLRLLAKRKAIKLSLGRSHHAMCVASNPICRSRSRPSSTSRANSSDAPRFSASGVGSSKAIRCSNFTSSSPSPRASWS